MSDLPKEVFAAEGAHEAVLRHLVRQRPNLAGLRILDLPCGRGAFSRRLLESSAKVVAVDLAPRDDLLFDHQHFRSADANQPLPFESASFDVVISIEGIEHFENPSLFLRELHRVLVPGGLAIVSTPNVNALWSRWELFRRGYHCHFQPVSDGEKMSGHLLPIDAVFIRGAAERAGMTLVEIGTSDTNRKNWFWEWLRPRLFKRLPSWIRAGELAYGEVSVYVFARS